MTRTTDHCYTRKRLKGFTSIELIIVILVLSVLTASIIIKNPFSITDYSSIAGSQLIADIQYVQMRAMGTGRQQNILFAVNTSSYSIREGTSVVEQKRLPQNVIIRSANLNGSNVLTFNTLGEPTFSSTISGTIDLGSTASSYKTITVLPVTGKTQ